MIGAVEDVLEPLHEEPEQRLVPARIERDDAGLPFDLEHPLDAARTEEANGVDDAHAEALRPCVQGEQRARRLDRRFELDVEQRLLPRQGETGRQRRRPQVRERRVVLGKRAIARDRRPHADDRERHAPLAFVELEVVDEPELRGIAQLLLRPRHIEIARSERRERDVLHRLEGRAHEHFHALAFGPHEHADRDVARHLVRSCARQRGGGECDQQDKRTALWGRPATLSVRRQFPLLSERRTSPAPQRGAADEWGEP